MDESRRALPRWAPLLIVVAAVSLLAAWAVRGSMADPGFAFLFPRDGAQWLRSPSGTPLKAPLRGPVRATFRHEFQLEAPLAESVLFVTAYRSASIYLDGRPLHQEPPVVERWKAERRVLVSGPIAAGTHTLVIACENDRGPPLARLRWPDANLRSGPDWLVEAPGGNTVPVQPIEAIDAPVLAMKFPTVREAFLTLLPWILCACLFGGAISWGLEARSRAFARAGWLLDPALLRWALMLAALLVGLNNLWNLELGVGRDYADHIEYLKYVAGHHRLPEIAQASQNFQAPLFYVIAASLYELLRVLGVEDPTALRWLRAISLGSGIAMIEVCYRLLRRVFPSEPAVQRAGLLMAVSMPLLLYESPTVGNEPLSGLLGAAAALAALDLFQSREHALWRFAAVGILWGLAALAKVSALVLAAPFALGFACWAWSRRIPLRDALLRALTVGTAFFATCGWFFIGNILRYGKPVIGGWDPQVGFEWWQFPGYRTLQQYTSFGEALHRPVYSLVQGLWDGLYAGLWFDVVLGGVPNRLHAPTWNYGFAIAALAWALPPTLALAVGAIRALGMREEASEAGAQRAFAALFAFFVAGTYLASIVVHSITVPYYSAMKTTYALAAAPSILVLILLGAAPLLRTRVGRIGVHAWLAAWIFLVGVAYWALPPASSP